MAQLLKVSLTIVLERLFDHIFEIVSFSVKRSMAFKCSSHQRVIFSIEMVTFFAVSRYCFIPLFVLSERLLHWDWDSVCPLKHVLLLLMPCFSLILIIISRTFKEKHEFALGIYAQDLSLDIFLGVKIKLIPLPYKVFGSKEMKVTETCITLSL